MKGIFNGERMNPEARTGRNRMNYIFHATRYNFAKGYVKDKVVLDIGCGTGYGAKILASKARKIFAVDNSQDAIEYAKKHYFDKKIDFRVANALDSDIDSGSVDMVICFELIEHLEQPDLLLKETQRVLRNNGLLILSTPNKNITSPNSDKPLNPFHRKEYTFSELKQLLEKYFKRVILFGEFPNFEMRKYRSLAKKVDDFAKYIAGLDFLRIRKLFPKHIRQRFAEGLIDKTIDTTKSYNKGTHRNREDYLISTIKSNNSDTKVYICLCRHKK